MHPDGKVSVKSDPADAIAEIPATVAQTEAETNDPYAVRSIDAQEQIADASLAMAIAAGLTFIVTTVGTYFIAKQVSHNRKTVEAMVRQNELAEAEQRPFLVVKPEIERAQGTKEGSPVSFNYVNLGKHTARLVKHHSELFVQRDQASNIGRVEPIDVGRDLPDGLVVPAGETSNRFRFANDQTTVGGPTLSLDLTKPGTDGFGKHMLWQDGFFRGYVVYSDVAAQKFWLRRFCFTCTVDEVQLVETSSDLNTEYRCNADGSLWTASI